jgi:hypothetical protein
LQYRIFQLKSEKPHLKPKRATNPNPYSFVDLLPPPLLAVVVATGGTAHFVVDVNAIFLPFLHNENVENLKLNS